MKLSRDVTQIHAATHVSAFMLWSNEKLSTIGLYKTYAGIRINIAAVIILYSFDLLRIPKRP